MGRYVPPDLEGTTSGNRLHQKRAPGTLRRDGSQTVRFEMPFAVWCTTCRPHGIIGQGVRFNAIKAKVGNYYSTPIWSFRMRHPACGGTIEIRTDPQNTTYVVTEGGKARDYGEQSDRVREGENGVPILTPEERERRREDAFASLEGKVEDKKLLKDTAQRIDELYDARDRDWDDTWSANKRVRASFRQERKILEKEATATEALKARLGTDIDILPENEEDRARARLVTFEAPKMESSQSRSLPSSSSRSLQRKVTSHTKPNKSAKENRAQALRQRLVANTRAALNPFGG